MNQTTPAIPRSLFVFSILYGGMVCIAGVLGVKQVALGPLAVEAGIFAFLLLVVLGSAVALAITLITARIWLPEQAEADDGKAA